MIHRSKLFEIRNDRFKVNLQIKSLGAGRANILRKDTETFFNYKNYFRRERSKWSVYGQDNMLNVRKLAEEISSPLNKSQSKVSKQWNISEYPENLK